MAHIVLPQAKSPDTPDVVKYADTAVPYVIKEMLARGALQYRMRVAIAGGAQLFTFDGSDSKLDVGRRNAETVKSMLSKARLKLMAEDIGGNQGRTLTMDATTGLVTVKQNGRDIKILANMLS
jgi:chemotaxis protein CheD